MYQRALPNADKSNTGNGLYHYEEIMGMYAASDSPSPKRLFFFKLFQIVFSALVFIAGGALLIGGIKLVSLGGSSYYLLAGIAYLAIAIAYALKIKKGLILSVITFVLTVIWALYEAHIDYWQLVPRLVVPAVIFMLSLWLAPIFDKENLACNKKTTVPGLIIFIALLATFVAAFKPHGVISNPVSLTKNANLAVANENNDDNWSFYGRNSAGTRFAPYTQITPENVDQLQVAWTYRTGRRTTGPDAGVDQNTPEQVGNIIYSCTPLNVVTALNADTGKPVWKFDPQVKTAQHISCRGVGYYDATKDSSVTQTASTDQQCLQRIVVSTNDARLFTLDAHTGELCKGFGKEGYVDLEKGMGPTDHSNFYHPTSTPVILGHIAIIGGWVWDVEEVEPSGVVRAFDVRTGNLVWAWDVGHPEHTGEPEEGKTYSLSTPNVWATPSFDKELNLIYLPTGNGPPDYWAGDRNEVKEKFGSAIVALDATTGQTKWVFQTTHHDVWDYDVPSQPTLFHMKNEQGQEVPALIQTTKRGQIFVLDRRTGHPISKVEEKSVPTSPAAQGERLSPTQPYSVDMPVIGAQPLTEKAMWGVSTFDQLWCRIDFKQANYQGDFTPPTEKTYIEWPGLLGGMNWGGISIDESTGMMFVNNIEMPIKMALVPKDKAALYKQSKDEVPSGVGTMRPQEAGPYGGVMIDMMMSPLGVPCNKPPFGTLSAINLNTKQLVWQVPMGTVEDSGPLKMKTHLHIPLGMPTLGGPTSTASGIVFYAGTQDYYLRAMDSATGKELWRGRLPVGAVSAPLIYQSPDTGKQYVVVSAGGASYLPDKGDYIVAFALPDNIKK